ncbi:uncharacterized protein LOC129943234 [Eupeodes corollae]|uniref:uncharacterized protein LOC129943234 n=1 Tax=Eupeodes corollae TaxID=290404 RepID=UPI0024910D4D|nr:uncharacterized protein LOC129943234 [Eupeodes corollae]
MSFNQLYQLKYLIIGAIFCKFISFGQSSLDSFQFDVNDILNEKFMPAHLLAQELETFLKGSSNLTREQFYKPDDSYETTSCNFTTAFSTMGFHRKMMNEYLATNFLAKQILTEFPLDTVVQPIERRIGAPSSATTNLTEEVDSSVKTSLHRQGKYIQNEMLEDPGSASYRSWLDKTTMLDDIQRQFTDNAQNQIADFKPLQQGISPIKKAIDSDDEGLEEEDFDEGDITGYAYTGGVSMDSGPNYPNALPPPRHHLPFDATNNIQHMQPVYPTAVSKNGYYPPSGQENSYENSYGQTHHVQPAAPQQTKEIGLKDILDIALTTLAFLSFGMFILQVLMCITMNKEDTSSMMMMPMEATDTGTMTPTNEGATEEIRRRKRNLPENPRIKMMNDLSRRVLHSIDAVLMMPTDNGRCQFRTLCDMNKYAREQKNGQKVWIPMWSLGISWFSSKMTKPNTTTGNPILESLKASVVGLGNGDCKNIYPDCQMEIPADERSKIERKRKKRDLRDRFHGKS